MENGMDQHDPNRLYWEVAITKSHRDDSTGDVIIEGIANTGKTDEQGEQLVPAGIDFSYFLKKGHIKWEHHAKDGIVLPDQFVGEPMEARVGPEGFYIKARLYGKHKYTTQIVEQMDTMEKSGSSRRMGFSIEGNALARDPKDPSKVSKSIIRNVALTMNGVDTGAWARIAKSMDWTAGQDLFQFDLVEKTLTTESAAPIMPQSLEGANREPDSYNAFANRVRQIIGRWLGGYARQKKRREQVSHKSITPDSVALDFYMAGARLGMTDTEAQDAARYGYDRADLLKGIATKLAGGELQMEDLLKSLDMSLDALTKSVAPDEEPEDEDQEADPDTEDEYEDENEDVNETEDEADDDDGAVQKSLTGDETIENAIEVSGFLEALVSQVGAHIDEFSGTLTKSIGTQGKVNTALAKSLGAMGSVMKSIMTENALLKSQLDDMAEVLSEIAQRPVGRKSVTSPRDMATIEKSLGGGPAQDNQPQKLNKSLVMGHLMAGAEERAIPITEVTLYETSNRIGPNSKQYLIAKGVLAQAN